MTIKVNKWLLSLQVTNLIMFRVDNTFIQESFFIMSSNYTGVNLRARSEDVTPVHVAVGIYILTVLAMCNEQQPLKTVGKMEF